MHFDALNVIAGVVLGVPPAVFISWYFFKKSFEKQLTPYLIAHSEPLADVGPELKSKLSVAMNGVPIENLVEAQFLVLNSGVKAIGNPERPLTLHWPQSLKMLDVQVVRKVDSRLRVEVVKTEGSASFELGVFNAKDWFIAKAWGDGRVAPADWLWTIEVDELGRKLKCCVPNAYDLRSTIPSRTQLFGLVVFAATAWVVLAAALLQRKVVAEWVSQSGILNSHPEPGISGISTDAEALLFVLAVFAIGLTIATQRTLQRVQRGVPDLSEFISPASSRALRHEGERVGN